MKRAWTAVVQCADGTALKLRVAAHSGRAAVAWFEAECADCCAPGWELVAVFA